MKALQQLYRRASLYYDILDWPFEQFRYRKLRPELWRGLSGLLVDLGAGTGRNAASYPRGARVLAVDLSWPMLARARRRIESAGQAASCVNADAAALPLGNHSVDACVSTFLFCVLPDDEQPAALREIRRVLKPGGRLVVLEYAYSRYFWRRAFMKVLSPLVAWLYGARFDRRTHAHLREAGFRITRDERADGDVLVWLEAVPA